MKIDGLVEVELGCVCVYVRVDGWVGGWVDRWMENG